MTEEFNQYGLRQIGDRLNLNGIGISVTEKKKEDGTTVRWAQISRYNKKTDDFDNVMLFDNQITPLKNMLPEIERLVKEGKRR
jgi:hypothetical protein